MWHWNGMKRKSQPEPSSVEPAIYTKVAPFPRARFLEFCKHIKIQSHDFGRILFKMIGSQTYMLDEIESGMAEGVTTFVILKARHVGSTTFFVALDMFWEAEHPGLMGSFIVHEQTALERWRVNIEIFLSTLPTKVRKGAKAYRFRPRVIKHNRDILVFGNDSILQYLVAGTSEGKQGGLGRSGSSNYVHATESAFYGNPDDIKAFRSSMSSVYAHRLSVEESTANGFNHFYDRCQTAKESPNIKFIFVGWWRNELFQFHVDDQRFNQYMPDNKITELEKLRVREVKRQYGFTISLQQLAWYRWKLEDEFEGDQTLMDQEFPFTEDDAFQATGSKFFEGSIITSNLRRIKQEERNGFKPEGFRYHLTRRWDQTSVTGWADPRADLRIWQHASRFGYYAVSCDPAYGSSDEADNNVIQVWRCFADGMDQVAEYASHTASTFQVAWVLAHLAGFYGACDSRVILELNGPGKAVFSELQNVQDYLREMNRNDDTEGIRNVLANMRHFYYSRQDSMSGELAYHWTMTDDLKRAIMNRFKSAVELDRMRPRSVPLLEEMKRTVNDAGHIAADGGGNDDRVVAGALAHECWERWMWKMLRDMHMTRQVGYTKDVTGGDPNLRALMINFLKKSNISIPTGGL